MSGKRHSMELSRPLVWAAPTLVTLAAGCYGISQAQPWRDELATWSAATRPVGDLFRLTRTIDASTGPYYLLLHAWTGLFGDSVVALRLPSVLAMAGAAGLTAVLGRRLFGAPAGLLAGLLFAVLPGTSRYAQEARPYALVTLFAVLATVLLVRALDRPGRLRGSFYAAAVAGLGLAHLLALSLLAAHAVVVLTTRAAGGLTAGPTRPPPDSDTRPGGGKPGDTRPGASGPGDNGPDDSRPGSRPGDNGPDSSRPGDSGSGDRRPGSGGSGHRRPVGGWRERRLWWWVVAVLVAGVVLAPLLVTAQGQRSHQLDWVAPARLADLAALPGGLAQSGVVGGLLVGLAALGAARSGWRGLLPDACVLLPVLLLFVAALAVPLWVPRYLFFTVPFACLLAGAALTGPPPPTARPGAGPPPTAQTEAELPPTARPEAGPPEAARPTPAGAQPAGTAGAGPAGTAGVTARTGAGLAVVVLAGLLGLPDQAAVRHSHGWPRSATVDYRGAAAVIAAGQRPGDAVVYAPRDGWLFLDLGIDYHLSRTAEGRTAEERATEDRTPGDRAAGGMRPRDVLVTRGRRDRADLWVDECPRPAECLAGVDRVWLVVAGRHDDPLAAVPGAKGDALRTGFAVDQVRPRPGVTVALLVRGG
ncbi:Dolichyl-phosphate-mannose-protein mannosyltransferase [Micromonospora matsumotoense]|uniref:Dolichyl-phosphate-mannose-protein mannosyltransferase n=2 Tax=Micromonospora matsumotoense TaxID=121616 RepID=A0A1C4W3P7_9ACTN|nr:Dolichyl-phosphate-mannose-protein mannosyltransferase [Micromonospora matsumotoense]